MKSFFNRRSVFRTLILSLALGALGISASAMAATGGLRITITEPDGTPITGARVTASAPTSLVTRTGVSSDDGTVILRGLIPGTDYEVEVQATGYPDFTAQNVAVVSNKQLDLHYVLRSADTAELGVVTVTGQSLAAIDTTSSSVGKVLTLGIVESLPTGRSYQSYLELVPAVKPSDNGNPASRSGVNFSNIGGDSGSSSDNLYILDGINVTNPQTGYFGSSINSEIIKEQVVLTGGIPAKYSGGTGLVSKVITKSGGNEFHGSLNYYFQNDSLVADDEHGTSAGFETYDTAFTLGGPIIEDELWFFLSYQEKHRTEEVLNPVTGDPLRTVDEDASYAFFKATWQITNRDRLQATFFNDPSTISGLYDPTIVTNRDVADEDGGGNYKLSYSHQWDSFSLGAYAYKHEQKDVDTPANRTTRNDVAFLGGNSLPSDRQLGGAGFEATNFYNRQQVGLTGEYWLNTDWGVHNIEFGFSSTELDYKNASIITGDGSQYASVALEDRGVTLGQYMSGAGDWSGDLNIGTSDSQRILNAIADSGDTAYFINLLDGLGPQGNVDGVITDEELQAYQLTQTAGNPNGQVNVYRAKLAVQNPYTVTTEGKAFYLQDSWTSGQWTANIGFRTEQWAHFASNGEEIFTFDWEFAPRLSVVYDLFGDGTSKVWAFYGRYYDPIRTNMTDFAGALTGNVTYEQIYLGNQWLTFRTRGGVKQRDATFVPSTKTPYTDEFLVGYETTLSPHTGLSVVVDYRQSRDLLEDFALFFYTNQTIDPNDDPLNHSGFAMPGSDFYLPYSYYGYEGAPPANINYFIGTLPGSKRDYLGLTVSLTKYRSDNWMGQLSYTYNKFEGNTNSDSNADLQGDFLDYDPRGPNRYGEMPGNINHMFQAYGTYYFDNGFQIGGVFNWNSGMTYNKAEERYGRYLPVRIDTPEVYRGSAARWVAADALGYTAPSYWTLDLRLKYNWDVSYGKFEFFMDIFNVLNNQAATSVMPLDGGNGIYDFQEADDWVQPRRFYLGVRYSF